MEPVSIIGITAAVVQFVDFTSKVLAEGYTLYTQTTKLLDQNRDVTQITRTLKESSKSLTNALDKQAQQEELTPHEVELRGLCARCHEVAAELLEALDQLSRNGSTTLFTTLYKALKSVRQKEFIDKLQKKIDGFRQELVMSMLVSLRDPVTRLMLEQRKVTSKLDQITKDHKAIGDALMRKSEDKLKWRTEFTRAIRGSYGRGLETSELGEKSPFLHAFKHSLAAKFSIQVLAKLKFREMSDRVEGIAEAHRKTFQWIFEDSLGCNTPWKSFKNWLRDDDPIYWITGKPGAGKSTLMKFISTHEQTDTLLRTTSVSRLGNLELIRAGFYFWNSGTAMQMSQTGLLRSLLHDVLVQSHDLLPIASPDLWENFYLFGDIKYDEAEELSWIELVRSFRRMLSAPRKRFFFIIDGLDEFIGDKSELVSFLGSLTALNNVKLCLASRPWVVFEDAFKHAPSLMVQDLTHNDIKTYITTKFSKNPGYAELQREDRAYTSLLIAKVAEKSSGVFLWVTLVVASLLNGLSNGDNISDLDERLAALPADLEQLFSKIFDSLEPVYRTQAAKLFSLVGAWRCTGLNALTLAQEEEISAISFQETGNSPLGPFRASQLTTMQLCFADIDNPDHSLELPIHPLTAEERSAKKERMRRRINSRCKGLLEVEWLNSTAADDEFEIGVHYLHRTVKDYLEKTDIAQKIALAAGPAYNPHFYLAASCPIRLKTEPATHGTSFLPWLNQCIAFSIAAAEKATAGSSSCTSTMGHIINILDDADETTRQRLKNKHKSLGKDIVFGTCPAMMGPNLSEKFYIQSFLAIAIHLDLQWYIKAKIKDDKLKDYKAHPLLICAIHDEEILPSTLWFEKRGSLDNAYRPELVRALLESGQDPNSCVEGTQSALHAALARVSKDIEVEGTKLASMENPSLTVSPTWIKIVSMLLDEGGIPTTLPQEYEDALAYIKRYLPDSVIKGLGKVKISTPSARSKMSVSQKQGGSTFTNRLKRRFGRKAPKDAAENLKED